MALRALVLVGYPVVGMVVSLAGVEPTVLSNPYRVVVFALACAILARSLSEPAGKRVDPLVIAFFALYIGRLLYDWHFAEVPNADRALLYFVVLVVVPTVASMRAGLDNFDDARFARLVAAMAALVLVLSVFANESGMAASPWAQYGIQPSRLTFDALNPISLGHVGCTAVICCFFLLIETVQRPLLKLASLGGIALGVYVILLANSRGPILAVAAALTWFVALRSRRLIYAGPLLFGLLLLIPSDSLIISNVTERFGGDFELNASNAARILAQRRAIEAFIENPVLGAYYIDTSLGEGNYPHNLTIESAMALGIVGLTMFLVLLLRAFRGIMKFFNADHPLLVMLLVQQFVGSSLSGALWGADGFFMMLSLCLIARPRRLLHGGNTGVYSQPNATQRSPVKTEVANRAPPQTPPTIWRR